MTTRRRRWTHSDADGGDGAVVVADADVLLWQSAVVTNGGTVSAGRFTIVNSFVAAEKVAGTWDLTDDYWGLWGENSFQALLSLKQRRLCTIVSTPTFTVDRGYTFDGVANYLATGFIPGTHKVAMTDTSTRVAAYNIANIAATTAYACGTQTGASRGIFCRPRTNVSTLNGAADSNTSNWTLGVSDSRGFSVIAKNGVDATGMVAYKNGVSLTNSVASTVFGALPSNDLYIGAINNAGTPAFGGVGTYQISLICIGASLTPTQETAQYTNVQAWATAIGTAV